MTVNSLRYMYTILPKIGKNVTGFCVEFFNGVLAILTLSIKYNFSIST